MSFPNLNLPPASLNIRLRATVKAPAAAVSITDSAGKYEVFCLSRRRFVALTPEEWVRQHFIAYLTGTLGYPQSLVAAEMSVDVCGLRQRADIVVYSRQMKPLMIVECKAPCVQLSQTTLNQACRYLSALGSHAVVLTNGMAHYCVCLEASEQCGPAAPAARFVCQVPTWQELQAL